MEESVKGPLEHPSETSAYSFEKDRQSDSSLLHGHLEDMGQIQEVSNLYSSTQPRVL